MSSILRIGLFENFGGRDSVLLAGDAEAMAELAGVFQGLASGEAGRVRLESLPFVEVYQQVSILAEQSPMSAGLRYALRDLRRPDQHLPARCFRWRLSAEDWQDVGLRVAVLQGPGPGHQYLDHLGVLDDVRVIVAVNEYDDAWWRRYG
jgi:hypothetical protein